MEKQWVTLCNRALSLCGVSNIESLDEGTEQSGKCSLFLPMAIETVLSEYQWNCGKKKITISRTDDDTVTESRFDLPTDFISLVSVNGEAEKNYELRNKTIFSSGDSIDITYISYPKTFLSLTANVKELIVLNLAEKLNNALVRNDSMGQRLYAEYRNKLTKAIESDTDGDFQVANWQSWFDEDR